MSAEGTEDKAESNPGEGEAGDEVKESDFSETSF